MVVFLLSETSYSNFPNWWALKSATASNFGGGVCRGIGVLLLSEESYSNDPTCRRLRGAYPLKTGRDAARVFLLSEKSYSNDPIWRPLRGVPGSNLGGML